MAERDTILSRGPTSAGPIQGPNAHAPQGSFGVYEGLGDLGRGLQRAGETGANIVSHHIERVNRLDASDMADRYKSVRDSQALKLQTDVTKLKETLLGDELDSAISQRGKELQDEIPGMMEDLRKRNPAVFAKVVSPEALRADWGTVVNNWRGHGHDYSTGVYQEQRWATRVTNTENDLKAVQGSATGSVDVGINYLKKFAAETENFTLRQKHEYQRAVGAKVLSSLEASAIWGKPDTSDAATRALDAGIIQPDDHARILATHAKVTDPKVIAADITKAHDDYVNRVAGGESLNGTNLLTRLDRALADRALLHKGDDGKFRNPAALYRDAVKPTILAIMQNKLSSPGQNKGFLLGSSYTSGQTLLAELDKPESAVIDQLVRDAYSATWNEAFIGLIESREAIKATAEQLPAQGDLNGFRTQLRAQLSTQIEMVNDWRANELYTQDAAVKQATEKNDPILLRAAYEKLFDRDRIPDDRRVYANPADVNALRQRAAMGSESEVLETEKMFQQFTKTYGKQGYGALMSLGRGNTAFNGLMAFAAQQTAAASPTEAANIWTVTTEMWQALAAQNSADMKKKTSDSDARLLNDVELFASAALSAGYAGEFKPGKAWAQQQDNKLRPMPRLSPLGQAATRAGIYEGLEALNLAMVRHYTFTRKSGTMNPNLAAAAVRDIIGRALIPVKVNGASDANPNPIYGFSPNIRSGQVPWYTPSPEGGFATQRHAAEVYGAAFDSYFLQITPKLGAVAAGHFAVKGVMARLFSGTHVGGNTELAQMLPINAMAWSIVRDNPKAAVLNETNIPFDRIGIVVEDVEEYKDEAGKTRHRKIEKFAHLSEDRLHISTSNFFPDTVRARVDEAIKRIDPTDRPGRAGIALANNHQFEFNGDTQSWDLYVPTGSNWAGTAGSVRGAGPRVTAVVLNEDGKTWKKFSLPAKAVGDRAAEIQNAGSYFRQDGAPSSIRNEMERQAIDRRLRLPSPEGR